MPVEPETSGGARRADEILAGDPYQPLTPHQKWAHFLHRTYSSATFAGVAENTVWTRVTGGFIYCCGAAGWGKEYGAQLADGESRQFFANYFFPTLLKQDPRYFPKRRGSTIGRMWYATTRVFVTRNDSGREAFNYSELFGVAFSKSLCNAYYPDRMRGGWQTFYNILGTFQGDATSNLTREFRPEIERLIHKHTPQRLQAWEKRVSLPNTSSQY